MSRRGSHYMAPYIESWGMLAEAQFVIAMRLAGIAGFWPIAAAERMRMVEEKPTAYLESMAAATSAAMALKPPAAVALAAIKPMRRRVRANRRRLSSPG